MTDPVRLRSALDRTRQELLAARSAQGHWVGELSNSALSTATAVTALALVERNASAGLSGDGALIPERRSRTALNAFNIPELRAQISLGLDWLASHSNPDGGWGDTIRSVSNLSTTTLVWSAFGAGPAAVRHRLVIERAERWLTQQAGSLEPARLAPAIIARYGKDRTFSVPILTMCALAGRLGAGRAAWQHVVPLPFELAACPHQWFAALRLPVVSYALPALIAIGQARHHHSPSRNPLVRAMRNATKARTLKILETIQPANGGFLEATPLTSFVVMSLAASGEVGHPVTRRGVEFLQASARQDGSWPIDTNLATWVTTLALDALDDTGVHASDFAIPIRSWLLAQQYCTEHPYTHAAPGGWAWTDAAGGVPDADDTAGALLALRRLGAPDERTREAVWAGTRWLLDLQNRDGGIPTFCRGWGALPFDRSSADITAHAMRAWLEWQNELPRELQRRVGAALDAALSFLCHTQRRDGSWIPLWFGNQFAPADENPVYGTSRVLEALCAVQRFHETNRVSLVPMPPLTRAAAWLMRAQLPDGSWGGVGTGASSIEETALAVEALAAVHSVPALLSDGALGGLSEAMRRGVAWLVERVESGAWKEPSPIGFYFAKLWYFEKLYPLIFTVGALTRAAQVQSLPLP